MTPEQMTDYRRISKAGLWPEANMFRENERKRLRASGRTRQQAREESWQFMLSRYSTEDGGYDPDREYDR